VILLVVMGELDVSVSGLSMNSFDNKEHERFMEKFAG
jgi:hypothetical protein